MSSVRPGDLLGKYRVIEEIGRGSMGTVYVGYDPLFDRSVALKVANEPAYRGPDGRELYRQLFFNEMRAASILSHPNIVEVFDAGAHGEHYYIAMEFVEGARTLETCCDPDGLLPLERVAEIVFKCAQALDYAHGNGVIHRDIKPGNILLSQCGDVKLADFSVALLIDPRIDSTQLMDPVGSPLYMSPEQFTASGVTNKSDLFSLGNVLYELLTGRLPFAAETLAGVTHNVLRESAPPVSRWRRDVPASVERIVSRALARDPEDRYGTAVEMAADLSMAFAVLRDNTPAVAVDDRVEALKNTPFFAEFRDAEIWELLRWSSWRECEDGEVLIAQGADDHTVYVLVSGTAEVVKDGRSVSTLAPGECFGEIAYLSRQTRTASIVATSTARVLGLNAEVLAQASLACQVQFQRTFIRTLLERLVATTADLVKERPRELP
ncbi:MAG: serine/threonine-protein kinase [Pseudomonadota bacterium]